jgi:AraC-like DNA-binding protein
MRLERLVEALPEPVNYFQGVSSLMAGLPRNVLLFGRDRPFPHTDCHHRYVLMICLQGPASVLVAGVRHALAPRQGFLVFPYSEHHYEGFSGRRIRWLFVTFELEGERALQVMGNAPWSVDRRSLELIGEMVRSFNAARSEDPVAADILPIRLAELLARLARAAESRLGAGPGRRAAAPSPGLLVRETVRYVHENIARPTGIADVAAHLGISPSRLRAIFRREVGTSLGRFMLRERANRAVALLGRTDMSVADIAAACGYESARSFCRAFRTQKGKTPTEFRNRAAGRAR